MKLNRKQRLDAYQASVHAGLIQMQGRADANETALFARSLEYISTELYNVEYPESMGRKLIPVESRVPSGAESYTYRSFDQAARAKLIHSYGDDFPLAEVTGLEFNQTVKGIGAAYQYSIQDLRASAMSGYPLDVMKAQAARDAIEREVDLIAAVGDTNTGLLGLTNATGIVAVTTTTGAAGNHWAAGGKTVAEILADVNKMQNTIVVGTKGIHMPTTLAVGSANWSYLSTTARSPTFTDDSLMQYILKQSPWLKEIVYWPRLDTAGASSLERVMMYEKNPRVLGLVMPQEFEQFAPQPRGMSFFTPCHARTGGVVVRFPKAVAYMDGTQ